MSLRRDEGCIYLCFRLRPVGFCFSKILHLCHLGVTKSACPTDAEKCPPTAICPYSRWRSQPLSRVSRKQRYNTLDFAKQNRVPTGMLHAPIGNPAAKGIFPLQSLIFLAGAYTNCKRQLAMPAQKMQKEACTGAWHRLPFGRKCRRKESIFFCIPAIRAAGTRDNEWKQSVLS